VDEHLATNEDDAGSNPAVGSIDKPMMWRQYVMGRSSEHTAISSMPLW
jgi:hypothetical protein